MPNSVLRKTCPFANCWGAVLKTAPRGTVPADKEIEQVFELYGKHRLPSHPTKLDGLAVNITGLGFGPEIGNCAEQLGPDATPFVIVQLIAFVVSWMVPVPLPKP